MGVKNEARKDTSASNFLIVKRKNVKFDQRMDNKAHKTIKKSHK